LSYRRKTDVNVSHITLKNQEESAGARQRSCSAPSR